MPLPRRIISYALVFCITLALVSCLLYAKNKRVVSAPSPISNLPGKTAFYLSHAGEYDLVFLGDSRTFCTMQPELLDPLLGARSFNLSHWAHWLPTQFAHVQDIVERIPKNATVVCSLGSFNFLAAQIRDAYPIGLRNVPRYLSLGIPLSVMEENLVALNPLTYLYSRRGALLERAKDLAARTLWARGGGPPVPPDSLGPPDVSGIEREFSRRPGVMRVEVQFAEGRPVAVSQFMAGGGYLLEELDPAHFRAKQLGTKSAPHPAVFQPDAAYWSLFLAMLDLLREHRIHVVVNVLEEAPYRYPTRADLLKERRFMDGPVRREVEARGFVYLRVDLDQLDDADYFDYNHMNSRGVRKFSALFAAALAPHLGRHRGQ